MREAEELDDSDDDRNEQPNESDDEAPAEVTDQFLDGTAEDLDLDKLHEAREAAVNRRVAAYLDAEGGAEAEPAERDVKDDEDLFGIGFLAERLCVYTRCKSCMKP